MKVLYLAHRIPFPPNKGDKIRSYHHVRHLARQHEVHLLAFVDDERDAGGVSALRELCSQVTAVRLRRTSSLVKGAAALARGGSLSEGFYRSAAMWRAVQDAARETAFDVAWAYSSVMAQYLPAVKARWQVADVVDVDSEKWRQFAGDSRPPLRLAYALESTRLRRCEAEIARRVDRVLVVSSPEAELYASFAPTAGNVHVVPNGVDTAYFRPRPASAPASRATLLFTGALDYRPNVDAVLHLVRDVLPLVREAIPAASVLAVGHRPSPRLLREEANLGGALRIAGSVPDVRPYFAEAAVFAAPLRLGRGVQNKVLEAMAMGLPVVASSLAVAGIEACPGTHVVTADSPPAFAREVVTLLRDPTGAGRMAASARSLLERHYTWDANLRLLEDAALPPWGAAVQVAGMSA
jgi:sugar transferase (PEP-CTERM/EpsH1 system associated)